MKNTFKGFHNVPQDQLEQLWKNDKTLFVFDANVLLNLYGYAKQTRDDFFKILESINEKVWIPYHAGLEYQNRRLAVIRNEKTVFNEIEDYLVKIEKVFTNDFTKLALQRRFPKLSENTEKLKKDISKNISNYRKSVSHWDSEQPCVRSHDEIRERLNDLFENKVGEKPVNQEWLNNLYNEGAERFKNKVPPGFKDTDKANKDNNTHFFYDGLNYERQYGDLIVWKQIIEKAKGDNVENIIFITDDAKDDWWYTINSNGKKNVGPLAQLQAEIYSESKISSFQMYSTSSFMKDGESFMAVEVEDSSIEDASTPHSEVIEIAMPKWYLDAEKFKYEDCNLINNKISISNLRNYIKSQDLELRTNRFDDHIISDYLKNIKQVEENEERKRNTIEKLLSNFDENEEYKRNIIEKLLSNFDETDGKNKNDDSD
ncbi:hypothetical protein AUR67_20015 [Pseudoalteromonas sp. XI10]|uniref:PIN-like domain-containing protein n=1 Tax=Pseudoalteromonas sp. XI10 TaxID=1766621 RepID=UPI00073389C8|nr:PIN-like domain-containing protein [Pseudoalteromonas sp. XI10]KTG18363.1 hypothetical protein AUR67_20015 [Pseudoalteromonas sp. XI10]